MGRCNIKHPHTGEWRCWSTIVDNWVSDWMSETDYKQWLINEATRQAAEEIEAYGIKEAKFKTYNECIYKLALQEHCEKCKDRFDKCDDCDYNITLDAYIEQGDDYFHLGFKPEPVFERKYNFGDGEFEKYSYRGYTIYHNYLGKGEWIIQDEEEQYNSKEEAIQVIDNRD